MLSLRCSLDIQMESWRDGIRVQGRVSRPERENMLVPQDAAVLLLDTDPRGLKAGL